MKQYLDFLNQALCIAGIEGDLSKRYYPTFASTADSIVQTASAALEDGETLGDVAWDIDDNIAMIFPSEARCKTEVCYLEKTTFLRSRVRSMLATMWCGTGETFSPTHACNLKIHSYTKNLERKKTRSIGFVATKHKPRQWHPVIGQFIQKHDTKSHSNRNDYVEYAGVLYPDSSTIKVNTMLSWCRPLCWHVGVSLPSTPKIYFMTDAIGVRELLKERDLREGKTRRDALLHWVSEHWRINRFDIDEEIRVRKHLRGMRHATCFGFQCEIEESDFDKREALEAKRERKQNRIQNRRRIMLPTSPRSAVTAAT